MGTSADVQLVGREETVASTMMTAPPSPATTGALALYVGSYAHVCGNNYS